MKLIVSGYYSSAVLICLVSVPLIEPDCVKLMNRVAVNQGTMAAAVKSSNLNFKYRY